MHRILIPALLLVLAPAATAGGDGGALASITPAALATSMRALSSDAFGGRAPASPGETKTIGYLRARFQAFGLEPGWHGSYFQTVPLSEITAKPTDLTIAGGGKTTVLHYLADEVAVTKREQPTVKIEASPMIFVGFGIRAPEFRWNDFAGLDLRGKTIVVLVNDPGYYDPDLFHGKDMTYYGRWTYKYEEAAREGAAAVLIVHQTGPAGYGWGVVRNSWSGHRFEIRRKDGSRGRAGIEGWITEEAAVKLFRQAGFDFAKLEAAAEKPGFKAVPLGLEFSATLHSTIAHQTSHNVVAMLPGGERPGEAIVYSAHWDHFGTQANLSGDKIFNGAVDNASGVSALIAIARAFTLLKPRPARSVLFLATTSEEQGLLGAQYYADHPAIPLANTVADINMDIMNVYGRSRDLMVIGWDKSGLQPLLANAAAKEGLHLEPYAHPETGMFYRTDLLEFARHGVPAIVTASGHDYIGRPAGWGDRQWAEYFADHYHKPADEFDPDWDLSGLVQQTQALFRLGAGLAEGEAWPDWNEGVPFKALRDRERPLAAASH